MEEYNLVYRGNSFEDPHIDPVPYTDSYFDIEIEKESELFYEMRKQNDMKPYKLSDESEEAKDEIKKFFNDNKDTFLFLFSEEKEYIGSVLYLQNYIQSLCVDKKYQNKGYGKKLVMYVCNQILGKGHDSVKLKVFKMNQVALHLYFDLGFVVV